MRLAAVFLSILLVLSVSFAIAKDYAPSGFSGFTKTSEDFSKQYDDSNTSSYSAKYEKEVEEKYAPVSCDAENNIYEGCDQICHCAGGCPKKNRIIVTVGINAYGSSLGYSGAEIARMNFDQMNSEQQGGNSPGGSRPAGFSPAEIVSLEGAGAGRFAMGAADAISLEGVGEEYFSSEYTTQEAGSDLIITGSHIVFIRKNALVSINIQRGYDSFRLPGWSEGGACPTTVAGMDATGIANEVDSTIMGTNEGAGSSGPSGGSSDEWAGGYTAKVEKSGAVSIKDKGGKETEILVPGGSIETGSGTAWVAWSKGASKPDVEMMVCPMTKVKLESVATCPINGGGNLAEGNSGNVWLSSECGSIRGTINGGGDFISPPAGEEINLAGKGAIRLSSEHGSVRGTCNGGGDFIMPPQKEGGTQLAGAFSEDKGRVGIYQGPQGTPRFILAISTPSGTVEFGSASGASEFAVQPTGGNDVRAKVYSGSTYASDAKSGKAKVIASSTGAQSISVASIGTGGQQVESPSPGQKPEPGICGAALILPLLAGLAILSRGCYG